MKYEDNSGAERRGEAGPGADADAGAGDGAGKKKMR